MKVFINPGHAPDGNPDPGAVGPSGLQESDVAAAVGRMVANILDGAGYDTFCYQSDSLQDICGQANSWGADLFISIHCNGHDDPAAHGTETWCHLDSQRGYDLAQSIQIELVNATGLINRGVKLSVGLYVLKYTNMPAALVELAFITHSAEEALLGTEAYQDAAARAIASGIEKYLLNGGM
ncbi:N-acetylmuramoyl-L-alanine amidase family protein [Acetonema longum]|uniref:N-acetylmuramoyl-l-alanine amidase, putative n=1 Tax=Acetonema longum DSM 6540 TaxID=1009370 RepID=F7NK45_9FIRM|nr:N-acetylmuramoyl-L-alanine amidase [Acetonema longum]EGO63486.1 n-acetylmuramoyl-l-alanine amidase, putative [Acetonema longum DSM 6540]